MQPDLFRRGPPSLDLKPVLGRTEPRLWVRRLVIWRDRGDVVRDVPLRPGLNVVWSVDAATGGASIGHGSGKTTFCRLLRYCLGEDSFAPGGQRQATHERMPNGRVGAEIRLDGRTWAVVRALGAYGQDRVLADAGLHQAFNLAKPTGMEPFRAAATALLGDAVSLMPGAIGPAKAWQAVLAWMTRDQECRFGHLFDWRDADSVSHSPVRGRSVEDRLTVVRAVLGALRAEERAAEDKRASRTEERDALRARLGHLDWQATRWRNELVAKLGFGPAFPRSELDAAALSKAAAERSSEESGVEEEANLERLKTEQDEQDRSVAKEREAELALNDVVATMTERGRLVKLLEDELPELNARANTVPLCPICGVPIDKARAEGCGISLHSCDSEALKAEAARKQASLEKEKQQLSTLRASEPGLRYGLAAARQRREQHRDKLDRLRAAAISRSAEILQVDRLVADADRYGRLLTERQTTADELAQVETERELLKAAIDEHRRTVLEFLHRLSDRYDAVVRHLVPGDVKARAKLEGNRLHLNVEMGGDRSTAAIESLKVVAFDLAVLTLCIEGETYFPGLLVHNSPREADLDLSIDHRLFAFARDLEDHGGAAQFQYVVTTTTAPPEDIASGAYMRLELRGAPASERLLRTDL